MECVANMFMNEMKKVEPENKFTKNSDASNMEPCKNNHNFRFDYLIMLKFYSIILQFQFYKGPTPPVINHTCHCKLGTKNIFVVLIIFLVNFEF
jgi:hypothetical protein